MLLYEKNVREAQDLYEECLNQKLKLLDSFNNDTIDINRVVIIGKQLMDERDRLKRILKILCQMNKNNSELKELIQGYLFSLSFFENKEQILNIHNQHYSEYDQAFSEFSGTESNNSQDINYQINSLKYQQSTCSVFISINQSERGRILAASNNFETIFGFQNVISQDISMIIPTLISSKYEQKVETMLTMIDYTGSNLKQMPLVLARTNIGLGIPVSVQMFIDYIPHMDTFGIIQKLEMINNSNYFALLHPQTFQLNLINSLFYADFIRKYFKVQDIQNLYFSKLVPISLLIGHSQTLKKSSYIDSICFLPNKEYNLSQFFFKTPLNISDLQEGASAYNAYFRFDIYKIRFFTKYIENYEEDAQIIEIFYFKKIKKQKEIQEHLALLKAQISQLLKETENIKIIQTTVKTTKQEEVIKLNKAGKQEQIESFNRITNKNEDGYNENSYKDLASTNYIFSANKQILQQFTDKNGDLEKYNDSLYDKKITYYQDLMSPNSAQFNSGLLLSPERTYLHDEQIKVQEDDQHYQNFIEGDKTQQEQQQSILPFNQTQFQLKQKSFQEIEFQKDYQEIVIDIPKISQNIQEQDQNLFNLFSSPELIQEDSEINSKNYLQILHQPSDSYLQKESEQQKLQSLVGGMINQEQQQFYTKNITIMKEILENYENNSSQQMKQKAEISSDEWSNGENSINSKQQNQRSRRTLYTQKSSNTNQFGSREALKHINHQIMKQKKSMGLLILNNFGIFSLFVMISLIVASFILMIETFEKANTDYKFVAWPMSLQSTLSQILFHAYIIAINDETIFPQLNQVWPTYFNDNMEQIGNLNKEANDLFVLQMLSDFKYATYFESLVNLDNSWIMKKDYISQKSKNETLTTRELTFILNYLKAHVFFSQRIYRSFNNLAMIFDNFDEYNQIITRLQNDIVKSSQNSLEQIELNTRNIMLLCIILSVIIICAIFPLYSIVQTQRQQVLKLFATLSHDNIKEMQNICFMALQSKSKNETRRRIQSTQTLIGQLSQHELSNKKVVASSTKISIGKSKNNILNSSSKKSKMNQSSNMLKEQLHKKNLKEDGKKKNISFITSLPKFSFQILIFGILGLLLVIGQPIINFFIIKNFRTEGNLNIRILSKSFNASNINIFKTIQSIYNDESYILYTLKSQFCGTVYFTYGNIYVKSTEKQQLVYNDSFFDQHLPSVFSNNDQILNEFYLIASESSSQTRYNEKEYQAFFYEVLKGNSCKVLKDNPQYLDAYIFSYNECTTIQNQILNQGFQVSTKYFLDLFKDVSEITNIQSKVERAKLLETWEKQFKIKQFSKFIDYMITIISVLNDFIALQGDQFLTENRRLQIILAFTQIGSLLLVFYFGWLTFYNSTLKSVNNTVKLLSLIDIQVVVANSYMMSFLNSKK